MDVSIASLQFNFLLDLHRLLTLALMAVLLGIPISLLTGYTAVAIRFAALAHLAGGSAETDFAPCAFLSKKAKHLTGFL